jgi:hypothetical protein
MDVFFQAPAGADGEDPFHTYFLEGEDVRSERDMRGGEQVPLSMAGKEDYRASRDLAQDEWGRRFAEGSLDMQLLFGLEPWHRVEPAATNDA